MNPFTKNGKQTTDEQENCGERLVISTRGGGRQQKGDQERVLSVKRVGVNITLEISGTGQRELSCRLQGKTEGNLSERRNFGKEVGERRRGANLRCRTGLAQDRGVKLGVGGKELKGFFGGTSPTLQSKRAPAQTNTEMRISSLLHFHGKNHKSSNKEGKKKQN